MFLVQERAVLAFVDASASAELIATLPESVNALGYAPGQALFYGLSGDRVVTIDTRGRVTDLGLAPHGVAGAYAGAVSGNRWYVRARADLYVLGVEPGTASYLTVLAQIPIPGKPMLGDWDFGPGGALYGVDSQGGARVTRVDVLTGDVTKFPAPGLEPGNSYGAVSVGPDGVMHALHNATGRLYHVPLDNPAASGFTKVGASTQSDAATCPIVWDNSTAPVPYPAAAHRQLPGGSLSLGEWVFDPSTLIATVKVRNDTGRPALLAGWLDLDGDGNFEPAERAVAGVAAGGGELKLRWEQPVTLPGSRTYLRLRLFSQAPGEAQPSGQALGGEVEDHEVALARPPPLPSQPQPPSQPSQPQPPPLPSQPQPPPLPSQPQPPSLPSQPQPPSLPLAPPSPGRPPSAPPSAPLSAPPSALPRPYSAIARHDPPPDRPLRLTFFAGVMVPAIVVAARIAARPRRP